ncbi:hypothetical protein LAC81_01925 [Ensifer adhaerens]|uniref:hypothetical protein n=1 Tax=Ensifer adhaerens TaxID=106592 RepID=UPI001CBC287A|nr:hypothetical protein [Ensifer adhaerens]MBZ7920544.1 hypothetical protein [Ensifer adhaerens]UAX93020.1 hypothetical protein LAC78_01920 [Ensifer adhaerens]UAY00656.1 hypothetical protein LAC80_01925 [Ensifer adhaerens]UAY08037.1 hypothetical protein LAC81_01925 [Ensifer adhaerens]
MPTLFKAEIWRGGETSNKLSKEKRSVHVSAVGPTLDRKDEAGISAHLSLKSKGGGVTDVTVFFPPSTFGALAAEMMKADRDGAIEAFAKALLLKK